VKGSLGVEDLGVNGRIWVTESWKYNKSASMHAGLISFRIGVTGLDMRL
jgi:hypothetical protein